MATGGPGPWRGADPGRRRLLDAALATRAGQDGRLAVVAIEELAAHEPRDPQDPLARLVFLVPLEGSEGAFTTDRAGGARVGGQVLVWRPSRVQVQPGELSCDPGTALARQGTRPPH